MEAEEELATRAEIFRFPAQVASLSEPLQLLVDSVFGESRYEESAWLRGFYLTSATQEGTPIDRLAASLRPRLRPARAPRRADRARRAAQLLPAPPAHRRGLPGSRPRHSRPAGESGGASGSGAAPRRHPPRPRCLPSPVFTLSYRRQPRRRRGAGGRVRTPCSSRSAPSPPARRRWTCPTSTWRWTPSTEVAAAGVPLPGGFRASSAPRRRRSSRRRRTTPTTTRCATSWSPAWSRCWRRPCGGRSAIRTSCSARSRPTG